MQVMGPVRLCWGIRGQLWMLTGPANPANRRNREPGPRKAKGRKAPQYPHLPFSNSEGLSLRTEPIHEQVKPDAEEQKLQGWVVTAVYQLLQTSQLGG